MYVFCVVLSLRILTICSSSVLFPALFGRCLRRCGIHRSVLSWANEGSVAVVEAKRNDFEGRIRKMVLDTAVYQTWRERNRIIFEHERKEWKLVLSLITDTIKAATWFWHKGRTYRNWEICNEWSLNDTILLSYS